MAIADAARKLAEIAHVLELLSFKDDVIVAEALELCESRSEEHTSELQSQSNLVCRLLLEKKKQKANSVITSFSSIGLPFSALKQLTTTPSMLDTNKTSLVLPFPPTLSLSRTMYATQAFT